MRTEVQGPKAISGLREIVDQFDVFFLDQFGVLHDGKKPYPGVIDAIVRLHQMDKRLVIITNSGKRAEPNLNRLLEMGFPKPAIHSVVSSGEVAWRGIESRSFGSPFLSGTKGFIIGRQEDDYQFHDLGLQFVEKPEAAEFILILGSGAPRTSMVEYSQLLKKAAKIGVPALCANPDIWMITGDGLVPAPGAIAEMYKKLGGPVRYVGKPYGDIYQLALASSSAKTKERVAAVGDSVEHDIRGAVNFGVASILVRSGVLADMKPDELGQIYSDHSAWPNYLVSKFQW